MRPISMKACTAVAWCLAAACSRAAPGDVAPDPRGAAEAAAREAVLNEQSRGARPPAGNSLGVAPFAVETADTALSALGYGLADLLITDLARSRSLLVVDRIRLDAVLREVQLVQSGRVDTATAPRVGRLVQASRLVLGRLTDGGEGNLAVDARIAEVATGEVRTAVSASAPLDAVLQAEKELAFRLLDDMQITLTPAERKAIEQLPTRNVAALLAYSRGVRYEAEAAYDAAAREYAQAVRLDPGFAAAVANLESVQGAGGAGPVQQQAGLGAGHTARAVSLVGDRVNWPSLSPLGSLYIATPFEGGADLPLPTTITIIIEVPQ